MEERSRHPCPLQQSDDLRIGGIYRVHILTPFGNDDCYLLISEYLCGDVHRGREEGVKETAAPVSP